MPATASALLPEALAAATTTTLQSTSDPSLLFFNTTYTVPCAASLVGAVYDNGSPKCPEGDVYNILGYRPATVLDHPVYMWTSGGYPCVPFQGIEADMPEMAMLREAASRGFLAAVVETPQVPAQGMSCDFGSNEALPAFAEKVYRWRGVGDTTSTSPLAVLCRLPGADCDQGIAIHGHSLGGLVASLAPRYAVGVTALLLWGAGSRLPYGDLSCCGIFSGGRSCCSRDQPIGGSRLPCLTHRATAPFLDKRRRRLIIATGDHEYGDCYTRESGGTVSCNTTLRGSNPAGSLFLGRQDSGYDCGDRRSCIQADGSGYYMPNLLETGDDDIGIFNKHNFHNVGLGETKCDEQGCRLTNDSYALNPRWIEASTPWGMRPALDWLAATARRKTLDP